MDDDAINKVEIDQDDLLEVDRTWGTHDDGATTKSRSIEMINSSQIENTVSCRGQSRNAASISSSKYRNGSEKSGRASGGPLRFLRHKWQSPRISREKRTELPPWPWGRLFQRTCSRFSQRKIGQSLRRAVRPERWRGNKLVREVMKHLCRETFQ